MPNEERTQQVREAQAEAEAKSAAAPQGLARITVAMDAALHQELKSAPSPVSSDVPMEDQHKGASGPGREIDPDIQRRLAELQAEVDADLQANEHDPSQHSPAVTKRESRAARADESTYRMIHHYIVAKWTSFPSPPAHYVVNHET